MQYIKGFNALRAFSVFLVVITHLDFSVLFPNTDFFMLRVWPMISGSFGVQIFFVLSGFLITRILLHEKQKKQSISIKNFFIKRVLRLFPPLIIFFILIGIANLFGYILNAKESLLYGVFYIYNFVPKAIYLSEMGHLWSLGVEEQFYLTWPFLVAFTKKIKALIFIGMLFILVCCCFIVFMQNSELANLYFIERWFIPASCPIIVGCLGAILNVHYTSVVNSICSHKTLILLSIILTYSFTIYAPEMLVPLGILTRSIAIVLVLQLIVLSQDKKWVQALEFKPLVYVGTISYGIYMYQGFFLRTGGGSSVWFQQFPSNIIFALALAVISYELIEKPILKLKNRL